MTAEKMRVLRFQIEETFEITGRGTVVVIAETTALPVGKELTAKIYRPDGSQLVAQAFKEWLLRRNPKPLEREAYLLQDIEKSQVPPGSFIDFQ